MQRKYLHWSDDELSYLKENYGFVKQDELVSKLRGRKYSAIVKKAQVLGVTHKEFACKKSNLQILLEDNPTSYYWIGFLLADGSFTDRRIQLGVATLDLSHLQCFLSYVGSTNSICSVSKNYHRVTMANVSVVRQLCDKFGISSRKTYEPCQIQELPQDDFLFSLIIGFIDGDGSVTSIKHTKKCHRLSVVGHFSWLENFTFMKRFLHRHLGIDDNVSNAYSRTTNVKLPQNTFKTKHQLASFYIDRSSTLIKIKNCADMLMLPYLQRKLGKIS